MIEMQKYIDRRSKTEIHIQLFQSFRTDIIEGRYPANTHLPSINELAQITQVSVHECEKVYDLLEKENLIFMEKGNYKSNMHPVSPIFFEQLSDFKIIIESRNLVYSVIDSKIEKIDYDPKLHPCEFNDKKLFLLNRKYFGNDQCLIYSQTTSLLDLFPTMAAKDIMDTGTYAKFFAQDHIPDMHSETIMNLRKLPEDIAKIMKQPKNIACSMSENFIHSEGNLIQYSRVWMITAGFRFDFTSEIEDR